MPVGHSDSKGVAESRQIDHTALHHGATGESHNCTRPQIAMSSELWHNLIALPEGSNPTDLV